MSKLSGLITAAIVVLMAMAPAILKAQGQVMFSYQGRVKVQGTPFNGTGQFKFAIVNTNGSTTLWSNDSTSTGGEQPTASIGLPVADGIFNVMMGDVAVSNMTSINATIFQSQTPLKLRVWFNGGNGFQQLNPDHVLVNLSLTTVQTGVEDFTVYVNDSTGNDANNGLSAAAAKKTIQAAVDTLPDRINCNITISIAPGTYYEEVNIHGFSVARKKSLTFAGDLAWVPPTGAPSVVISAASAAQPTIPVREYGFFGQQCSGITIDGIHFTRASKDGLHLENGLYNVTNCLASYNNEQGFQNIRQTDVTYTFCRAFENNKSGFHISTASRSTLHNCSSTYNGTYGVEAFSQSRCNLTGTGDYSFNGQEAPAAGARAGGFSDLGFTWGEFSGTLNNNIGYAYEAGFNGYVIHGSHPNVVKSGNTLGVSQTYVGGTIYP